MWQFVLYKFSPCVVNILLKLDRQITIYTVRPTESSQISLTLSIQSSCPWPWYMDIGQAAVMDPSIMAAGIQAVQWGILYNITSTCADYFL